MVLDPDGTVAVLRALLGGPASIAGTMDGLGSAPLPPLGGDDHVRGPASAPLVILYGDFECPACALAHARLATRAGGQGGLRICFRHFPVPSKHPRAKALATAAEAAARQGAFWAFHDSLFEDQGHLDDPHLWARAERLGLDLARFEADRRSPEAAARVERDFRSGVRAGVVTTPTLFVDGTPHPGVPGPELIERSATMVRLRVEETEEREDAAADRTRRPEGKCTYE